MAHSHGHDHSHAASSRKRLIGALAVTALVFVGELIAAYISGSLSLAADAGHMAVDSSGLVIALLAAHLSLRPRDNAYTWGWARSEVIAASSRKRLIGALAVTALVFVGELIAAYISGSLSLAADAGHMAVDSSGLVIALLAAHLSLRPRDNAYTWGWARSEVIAAALQAGMLLAICLIVAYEAVERLWENQSLQPLPMLVMGVVGLLANLVSLAILAGGRGANLNMRAAFLEVANDALGSVAVIVAALVALATGWGRADAVASLLIAALMAPRALHLLQRSTAILMEATPSELNLDELRQHMCCLPGVVNVHDLHVSSVSSGLVVLTAHVQVDGQVTAAERDLIVHDLSECAAHHFPVEIDHATFQLETARHAGHEHLEH